MVALVVALVVLTVVVTFSVAVAVEVNCFCRTRVELILRITGILSKVFVPEIAETKSGVMNSLAPLVKMQFTSKDFFLSKRINSMDL